MNKTETEKVLFYHFVAGTLRARVSRTSKLEAIVEEFNKVQKKIEDLKGE